MCLCASLFGVSLQPSPRHSGREITIATIYSVLGKPVTENLTVDEIWSNETRSGLQQIERSVTHMDFHDRDLLEFMVCTWCSHIAMCDCMRMLQHRHHLCSAYKPPAG